MFIWCLCGVHIVFVWCLYSLNMVSMWRSYGVYMMFIWCVNGICMTVWCLYCTEFIRCSIVFIWSAVNIVRTVCCLHAMAPLPSVLVLSTHMCMHSWCDPETVPLKFAAGRNGDLAVMSS